MLRSSQRSGAACRQTIRTSSIMVCTLPNARRPGPRRRGIRRLASIHRAYHTFRPAAPARSGEGSIPRPPNVVELDINLPSKAPRGLILGRFGGRRGPKQRPRSHIPVRQSERRFSLSCRTFPSSHPFTPPSPPPPPCKDPTVRFIRHQRSLSPATISRDLKNPAT